MVQWLILKSLKAANVVFGSGAKPSQLLVQYFTTHGHFIRRVHFNGEGDEIEKMYLVACFCKNIDVIKCTNMALSSAFHVLLMKHSNIKEIWIHNCKCLTENLMSGVSLHKLSIFSAEDGSCLPGFPWSATTHSTSLQRVECCFLQNCYPENMAQLVQNCPQLRSFSCRRINYTDVHFELFFGKPLGLLNLDLSTNNAVTDGGILFIAQKLTSLRTLNIQHCSNLSHQYLTYIAENCAQLEVLYISVVHADSATAQAVP